MSRPIRERVTERGVSGVDRRRATDRHRQDEEDEDHRPRPRRNHPVPESTSRTATAPLAERQRDAGAHRCRSCGAEGPIEVPSQVYANHATAIGGHGDRDAERPTEQRAGSAEDAIVSAARSSNRKHSHTQSRHVAIRQRDGGGIAVVAGTRPHDETCRSPRRRANDAPADRARARSDQQAGPARAAGRTNPPSVPPGGSLLDRHRRRRARTPRPRSRTWSWCADRGRTRAPSTSRSLQRGRSRCLGLSMPDPCPGSTARPRSNPVKRCTDDHHRPAQQGRHPTPDRDTDRTQGEHGQRHLHGQEQIDARCDLVVHPQRPDGHNRENRRRRRPVRAAGRRTRRQCAFPVARGRHRTVPACDRDVDEARRRSPSGPWRRRRRSALHRPTTPGSAARSNPPPMRPDGTADDEQPERRADQERRVEQHPPRFDAPERPDAGDRRSSSSMGDGRGSCIGERGSQGGRHHAASSSAERALADQQQVAVFEGRRHQVGAVRCIADVAMCPVGRAPGEPSFRRALRGEPHATGRDVGRDPSAFPRTGPHHRA